MKVSFVSLMALVIFGGTVEAADTGSDLPKPKNDNRDFAESWVANLKVAGPLRLIYRHRSPAGKDTNPKKGSSIFAFATKGEDYVLWRGYTDEPKLWIANARCDGKFYSIEHVGTHHAFVYNTNLVKGWQKNRVPPRFSTSSTLILKNPCLIPLRFLMLGVKDQGGAYISSAGETRWSDLFIPGYAGLCSHYYTSDKHDDLLNLEFKDIDGARHVPPPESEKGHPSAELPRAKLKLDTVEVEGKKIMVIASAEVEAPWYRRDTPFVHTDDDYRNNMFFTYKVVGTAIVPAEIKFTGPEPHFTDVGGYVLDGTSFKGRTDLGPMTDKPIPALINDLLEEVPNVLDAATGMALD